MATHSQNIDNLQNAVLGEQVRTSMIELFNEDYGLVKKAVGIGTAIDSASSSTTGYYDGNIYINNQTMDIWQMDGYGWNKVGNLKSISSVSTSESSADYGDNVITFSYTDGTTQNFTIKNGSKGSTGYSVTGAVDNGDGTFYLTLSNGGRTGNVATIKGLKGDQGIQGVQGPKGRDVTAITMAPSQTKVHSIVASYSDGVTQVIGTVEDGADGTGNGDMRKERYATLSEYIVDKAYGLSDGTTDIPASSVAIKSNSLSGYGIEDAYTKTEVNELIDENEPEWTNIDNKPFAEVGTEFSTSDDTLALSDTVKSELAVASLGDAYNSSTTYSKGDCCISNNVVYKSKVDNNTGNAVTNTTYWEQTTLGSELGELNSKISDYKIRVMSTSLTFGSASALKQVSVDISSYGFTDLPFVSVSLITDAGNKHFEWRLRKTESTKNTLYFATTSDRDSESNQDVKILLIGK